MSSPKCDGGLGFKNLGLFNLALLAKQGWRVIHIENSLLHRVWKAKYFPTSLFLEAELGKHSSFAWRGLESKNVAEEGVYLA